VDDWRCYTGSPLRACSLHPERNAFWKSIASTLGHRALWRRAKTLAGLLARLAAKVAAYTCGQRINDYLGRPLRHLADLLV